MGYFDKLWQFRAAVSVSHVSGTGTQDVTIVIPANWDHFWENIKTAGEDIRLCAADGETLTTYSLASFNLSARTGTISVDAVPLTTTTGMYLLWLYYGNSAASSATAATTITSAETGAIELARPPPGHSTTIHPEQVGDDRPRNRLQKGSAEQLYLGFDLRKMLQHRVLASGGGKVYEEIFFALVSIELAGSPQASMVAGGRQRFVEDRGAMWILAFVKAGSAGDYTVILEVNTYIPAETTHRILEPRVLLRIKDQDET